VSGYRAVVLGPWVADAACADLSDVSFFPPERDGYVGGEEWALPAKAICGGCPVRAECLEHAMAHEDHGVWGGMTPRERTYAVTGPRRRSTRCINGHAYTPENTYERPDGSRFCRACNLASKLRRQKEAG
jgi:WhiB family redox-sensing transcriptional regulator